MKFTQLESNIIAIIAVCDPALAVGFVSNTIARPGLGTRDRQTITFEPAAGCGILAMVLMLIHRSHGNYNLPT